MVEAFWARQMTPFGGPRDGHVPRFSRWTVRYAAWAIRALTSPLHNNPLETGGIEPPSARCDRAVIPLHYVPDGLRKIYCTLMRTDDKSAGEKTY